MIDDDMFEFFEYIPAKFDYVKDQDTLLRSLYFMKTVMIQENYPSDKFEERMVKYKNWIKSKEFFIIMKEIEEYPDLSNLLSDPQRIIKDPFQFLQNIRGSKTGEQLLKLFQIQKIGQVSLFTSSQSSHTVNSFKSKLQNIQPKTHAIYNGRYQVFYIISYIVNTF